MGLLTQTIVSTDVPWLQAFFVAVMPEGRLYDSWIRQNEGWDPKEVSKYIGDLFRANRESLNALGTNPNEMQMTIEALDKLLVLREINMDFVCASIIHRKAPLGMVRAHLKRIVNNITEQLPKVQTQKRPKGVRLMEFLERYAPDPHAILFRLSLRTSVPLSLLQAPEKLSEIQVAKVETAALGLLGLEQLAI